MKTGKKNILFEIVSNISRYYFNPGLGISLSFNWEIEKQIGIYIYLIFITVYFDWFE
jgi:hypothetical protein